MQIERIKIADLVPDPQNVRLHDERNLQAVRDSLARFGQQKPIVVDARGVVVAGNGTLQAARALGWSEIDAVRTALEGPQARAYAIADNRTSDLSDFDDQAVLAQLRALGEQDADLVAAAGFSDDELQGLVREVEGPTENGDGGDSPYTNKIVAPVYEPKGDQPAIRDLYDRDKTASLIKEIEAADIPPDVAAFLKLAAERHTSFHFRNVAEFYCHADSTVQDLMERSGLVIIDFDKAIEYGFVHLTERLGQLADIEEGRGDGDA